MGELKLSKTFKEKQEQKKFEAAFINLRPLLGNFN